MEERKGLFTPEQEKKLDDIIKFNNPVLEGIDGPIITMIDNQGLERAIAGLRENNPELWPIIVQVIDVIFAAIPAEENQ